MYVITVKAAWFHIGFSPPSPSSKESTMAPSLSHSERCGIPEPSRGELAASYRFVFAALFALVPFGLLALAAHGCDNRVEFVSQNPVVKFVESNTMEAEIVDGWAEVGIEFQRAWGLHARVWAVRPDGGNNVLVEIDDPGHGVVTVWGPALGRDDVVLEEDACWCGSSAIYVDLVAEDGQLVDHDRSVLMGMVIDWSEGDPGGDDDTGAMQRPGSTAAEDSDPSRDELDSGSGAEEQT
jgi:hypothetical protein